MQGRRMGQPFPEALRDASLYQDERVNTTFQALATMVACRAEVFRRDSRNDRFDNIKSGHLSGCHIHKNRSIVDAFGWSDAGAAAE